MASELSRSVGCYRRPKRSALIVQLWAGRVQALHVRYTFDSLVAIRLYASRNGIPSASASSYALSAA